MDRTGTKLSWHFYCVWGLVLCSLLISRGDQLFSAYLLNRACVSVNHLRLLDSTDRRLNFSLEAFRDDEEGLQEVGSLLDRSVKLSPANGRAWLLRSLVGLALEDRQAVLEAYRHVLILNVESPFWQVSQGAEYYILNNYDTIDRVDWAEAIDEVRIEHHLQQGHEYADRQEWALALQEMRKGLALAGENVSSAQLTHYYTMLSSIEIDSDSSSASGLLRQAKWMRRAGKANEAIETLQVALDSFPSVQEGAQILTELGQSYWDLGQTAKAVSSWEESLFLAPSARACFFLLKYDDISRVNTSNCLGDLQPQFVLGSFSDSYKKSQPYELENGASLVGYDVDVDLLEVGPEVDIIFWWKLPSGIDLPDDWGVKIEDWWLQHLTVANLAPNAGFEWEGTGDGLPLGYQQEIYRAGPGGFRTVVTERINGPTQVLLLDNSHNPTDKVGIVGPSHRVDPGSVYLLGGWTRESELKGGFGCQLRGDIHAPYYVSYPESNQLQNEWAYFAEVALLTKGYAKERDVVSNPWGPITCRALMINYKVRGKAMFDNIIIIRLRDLPQYGFGY